LGQEPPHELGVIHIRFEAGAQGTRVCGKRGAMTSALPHVRERAERASSRTQVRLLWRQGTRQLWLEVWEADDRVLVISVRPEWALDAFHHPYAYAGTHRLPRRVESLASCEGGPQAAGKDSP
jgi:hypothetical protein